MEGERQRRGAIAADAYDSFGRITQLTDARGKVTQYAYGGNVTNAYLTSVTRVSDGTGPANLVTTIGYDAGGNVSAITDEGGGTRSFQYDGFGRLTRVLNSSGSVVKAYGYVFSRTSGNGWVFDATSPNAVVDSTFMSVSPTLRAIVTTGYLDGLGRPIQTVTQNGAESIVAAKEYDTQGRPWRTWKPYPRTGSGYDPGFVANATAYCNQLLGVADAKPYSDSLYTADALSRVTAVIPEAWRPTTRRIVSAYDVKPSSLGYPWSLFSAQLAGVTLGNVTGRLAGTASKSNGAWQLRTRHTP